MKGPLSGMRVLEVGRMLAGPYATQLLGDLGAEVIKIEKPDSGDETRHTDAMVLGTSGYFLGLNRNKRSITVDLRTEDGQRIIRELAARSDVLLQNFRDGYLESKGLGYDDLSADHPGLVYVSIAGFGPAPGLEHKPGMDILVQAFSGMMDITGEADGPPVRVGPPVTDFAAAMLAALGAVAALTERHSTGRGQHVKVNLLSAAVSLMANYTTSVLNADTEVHRFGTGHPQIVPYQALETSDRPIIVGVINKKFWVRFCEILELPELIDDERFRSNARRIANRTELIPIVHERLHTRSSSEWLEAFDEADIPCAPINTLRDCMRELKQWGPTWAVETEHASLGSIVMPSPPIDMQSGSDGSDALAPPELGQHTRGVLAELGYDDDAIEDLRRQGSV